MFTGCGNKDTAPDSDVSEDVVTEANDASDTGEADGSQTSNESSNDQNIKIGIIQLIEHPALDAARDGFIAGLAQAGYVEGENLTLDIQNAQGDQSNCQTIAGQFANDDLDLILAIATPAAQAVANVITDTPILVTAVTDPAAANLVDSNEVPGGNLSGTSDRSPIDQQIQLIKKLVPDATRVTILYTSSETNSELQAREAEQFALEEGLEVEIKTVSSSNEVQQVVESSVTNTDALYIPTDNLLASSMGIVSQVAIQAKVPVIGGEENQLLNGALATVGLNYFDLGKQTAAMAEQVFNGESIADMPIQFAEKNTLAINFDTAEAIGLEIPADLVEEATAINNERPE
ncbi:MAG TPA: ABC transporter substrate-binding protein [Clostridiaceae bacterium]|nr:ABC transporter substrate-binding protein [Clostridiaceae bacterium]